MKKFIIFMVAAFLAIGLSSCFDDEDESSPNFTGSWLYTGVFGSMSNQLSVYTDTTLTRTVNGSAVDKFSVLSYDESQGHLKQTCTEVTSGDSTVGDTYYITYSVSGSTLYMAYSTTAYPSSSTQGTEGDFNSGHFIYTKQ
ncbi:MAG: hypothetical protein GY754_21795 [bacterium]|nr:hypothetical protein [bacterium]